MKLNLLSPPEWHKRYDNIDGTGEILMGLMFLAFALCSYLQTNLPMDSIWRTNALASLLFMYAVLFLVLGPGYLFRRVIKKRITFPRTGYVALGMGAHHENKPAGRTNVPLKKSSRPYVRLGIMAAFLAAGFAGLLAIVNRRSDSASWMMRLFIAGYLAFWVLIYAFWVWQMGREYQWKWGVLSFMALGLLLMGIFGPATFDGLAHPVMWFVGVVWVVSGLATLLSYLRHTNHPAPEIE
jgi:tellurite resistance protein TehA-like permease